MRISVFILIVILFFQVLKCQEIEDVFYGLPNDTIKLNRSFKIIVNQPSNYGGKYTLNGEKENSIYKVFNFIKSHSCEFNLNINLYYSLSNISGYNKSYTDRLKVSFENEYKQYYKIDKLKNIHFFSKGDMDAVIDNRTKVGKLTNTRIEILGILLN